MPRKNATDAEFDLKMLMEKFSEGHCVFVDLEKANGRVPREELCYGMRKSGVIEKYVSVVQDMHECCIRAGEVCCRCNTGAQGGTGSRIDFESLLVCYGDGQVDR